MFEYTVQLEIVCTIEALLIISLSSSLSLSGPGGLSVGHIAGIVIGVLLILLLIVVVGTIAVVYGISMHFLD